MDSLQKHFYPAIPENPELSLENNQRRSKLSKPKASQVKGGPIVVIHNTSQEDIALAMKEAK
jgi:regulator of replication initiation timing